ncbi:MAG: hypothetical protein ACJAS0_002943, partial [Alcanivorax borkumensis]
STLPAASNNLTSRALINPFGRNSSLQTIAEKLDMKVALATAAFVSGGHSL